MNEEILFTYLRSLNSSQTHDCITHMATQDQKPGLMNSVQKVKGRREGRTTIFMEIEAVYDTEVVVYRLYEDLHWMFVELSKSVLNGPYMGCILPPPKNSIPCIPPR